MKEKATILAMILMALVVVSTTTGDIIYVDDDAPGANDGSSWADAFNYLQDALAAAWSGDEIQVAEGIYTPDSNSANPNGNGDRTATFQLINGVTIKGGYAGFGELDPNVRDIEIYETILSGDLSGNDVDVNNPSDLRYEPTHAENSYNVATGNGTDANAVLEGFTITGGNSNILQYQRGGGMYNESGSPTLANCTFTVNSAVTGGGMSNRSGNPTLTNCTFAANWADVGGGISNGQGNPKLTKCRFVVNNSSWHGGGIYNAGSISVMSCIFIGNTAQCGGGMFNEYYTPGSVLTNCIFVGNRVNAWGGGIFNGLSDLALMNCTFVGNSAEDEGGGLYIPPIPPPSVSSPSTAYYGYSIVQNCIFRDNLPEQIVDCMDFSLVAYNDIKGGWRGFGNIDCDPCFADPNNVDYHLKSQAGRWDANSESWVKDDVTSPCIDAGNPGCPVGDEPEHNGNRRNMGAYGGTAEASKSPTYWRSIADMTNDWVVDANDLKVFTDYWLQMGQCIPGDFDRSQFVDFNDYAILGGQWRQKGPGPGITYEVGQCIPIEPALFVGEEPGETRFTVTVKGRNVHFEDLITANCCADEIELQMTVEAGLITINEIERILGVPCPCICDYPITARLGPFEPGIYILEVYQDDYFVGTTSVTIAPGG